MRVSKGAAKRAAARAKTPRPYAPIRIKSSKFPPGLQGERECTRRAFQWRDV
jgi:hypothetical protein